MGNNDYMDWNGTITNDSAAQNLLAPGTYSFRVTKLDKTTSNSSGAPMAVVTLDVYDGAQSASVIEYLVLTRASEWKLSAFFRAIGMKKHGEPFVMNWDAIEGCTGRAEVFVDEYTRSDGGIGKKNKVRQYLDKDEAQENLPTEDGETIPF